MPGPDTRVVELRVHGTLGTTPEDLVGAVSAVDVAGDGIGRIVRPADRLRRPAPGPVLTAERRPLPRTLEGYVWGAMTSGGAAKAIWALLFPFSLANVSSWMLPPIPKDSRVARALGVCCRALLRLAALLLTVLLIGQLATVSLDLLAGQCLAPGSACLSDLAPDAFRQVPFLRPAIGVVPLLVVIWVMDRISRVDWSVSTDTAHLPPTHRPSTPSGLPGGDLIADPDAPALRALHVTAALTTVALLGFGGPRGPLPGTFAGICWTIAIALLGLSLLGVLVFGDPTGARPDRSGRWLRAGLAPLPRRALIALAVVLTGAVIVGYGNGPRPGTDATVGLTSVALVVAITLFGVLLVPAALLARPQWAALPRDLRPWAGGWLAAPFMALAALLGGGFGAGIGITVRQALGGGPLVLPPGYASITLLWGASGALGAVAALFGLAASALARMFTNRPDQREPVEVTLLHAQRPTDAAKASGAWAKASWQRRHAHHVLLASTGLLCAGTALAGVLGLDGIAPPGWTEPLSALGVVVLGALAGGLLRAVYNAARRPNSARHLGGLADLVNFWPRATHPIVPPCYALKAVPELAGRAAEHLAEPNTRVVLTGHSQGSVLACVAAGWLLASLPPNERERLGVVVAGSPLQWAYPRAFPAVLPHHGLRQLYAELDGRWRALCRGTDPLGGGVTTWNQQVVNGALVGVGFHAHTAADGILPAAVAGPTGALVLGGDHWLPDPAQGPFPGRRWAPGVLRHTDYYSDPEWDRAIACAAGMESPTLSTAQPTLFGLSGR